MSEKIILLLSFLIVSFSCFASEIRVSGQEEFDALGSLIQKEIAKGEKQVRVVLSPGHYFFRENHIDLIKVRRPDVSLSIEGHDAFLTGEGKKGPFDLGTGFVDLKGRTAMPAFHQMKNALGIVEFLDAESGLCRMPADEKPVKARKVSNMYILLTQAYLGRYYPVRDILDGYVYFYAPGADGNSVNSSINPNRDHMYGKVLPRYALVNNPVSKELRVTAKGKIKSPSGSKVIRCDAGCFLSVRACEFKSLKVSGLNFLGSGGSEPLLHLYRSSLEGAQVSGCTFDGIKGDVLRIIATSNVSFKGNTVRNCHTNGVYSRYESARTVVSGNRFYNNGTDVSQYFCVICRGSDFLISDNYFEDFTYAAIDVGVWYKSDEPHICSGIVENNECCLSPSYNSGVYRNLMDSGAIYTGTINEDVTIRNNYVHDISGPRDNRGIFCDDGTVNVKLIGNRVERIANSFCIDLRLVLSVETIPGSRIKKVNVGNVMKDNVVDGKVRFENRD